MAMWNANDAQGMSFKPLEKEDAVIILATLAKHRWVDVCMWVDMSRLSTGPYPTIFLHLPYLPTFLPTNLHTYLSIICKLQGGCP